MGNAISCFGPPPDAQVVGKTNLQVASERDQGLPTKAQQIVIQQPVQTSVLNSSSNTSTSSTSSSNNNSNNNSSSSSSSNTSPNNARSCVGDKDAVVGSEVAAAAAAAESLSAQQGEGKKPLAPDSEFKPASLCEPTLIQAAVCGSPFALCDKGVPVAPNEEQRMATYDGAGINAAPSCPEFDCILETMRVLFDAPNTSLALFYNGVCWLASTAGFPRGLLEWKIVACPWNCLVTQPQTIVCSDLLEDARFHHMPWVPRSGDNSAGWRCYCSAPLLASNGHRLGTVCFMDMVPRKVDAGMCRVLNNFSELAVRALERHLGLAKKLAEAQRTLPPHLARLAQAAVTGKAVGPLGGANGMIEGAPAGQEQQQDSNNAGGGDSSNAAQQQLEGGGGNMYNDEAGVQQVDSNAAAAAALLGLGGHHHLDSPDDDSHGPSRKASGALSYNSASRAGSSALLGNNSSSVVGAPGHKPQSLVVARVVDNNAASSSPLLQQPPASPLLRRKPTVTLNVRRKSQGGGEVPAAVLLGAASTRQLRSMEAVLEACVLIVDTGLPGWPVVYADETWRLWAGYSRAELVGKSLHSAVAPAAPGVAAPRWETLAPLAAEGTRFLVPGMKAILPGTSCPGFMSDSLLTAVRAASSAVPSSSRNTSKQRLGGGPASAQSFEVGVQSLESLAAVASTAGAGAAVPSSSCMMPPHPPVDHSIPSLPPPPECPFEQELEKHRQGSESAAAGTTLTQQAGLEGTNLLNSSSIPSYLHPPSTVGSLGSSDVSQRLSAAPGGASTEALLHELAQQGKGRSSRHARKMAAAAASGITLGHSAAGQQQQQQHNNTGSNPSSGLLTVDTANTSLSPVPSSLHTTVGLDQVMQAGGSRSSAASSSSSALPPPHSSSTTPQLTPQPPPPHSTSRLSAAAGSAEIVAAGGKEPVLADEGEPAAAGGGNQQLLMVPPAASLSVAGGSVVHCGDDDNNIESRIFDLAFRPLALDLLDEDTLPCGLPSFVPMEACPPMLRLYAVRLHEPAPLPAPAQPLAPGAMLTSLHASTVASQASHLFPGMGVKQVLGRGGYGTAYYGTWHDTDVVLKVQDHELKNLSALREAQLEVALGQMLRHPNLVRTLAHSAVEVNKQGWPHGGGTGVSSAISGGCPMASCSPLPSVWPMWGGGNNNSNNDGDPMADWDSCGADKWFEHSDAVMKRPPDWVNNISGLPPAHFLLDATSLAPDAPVPFAAAMLDATQQAKQAAAAAATNATAAGAAQASSLQGAAAAAAVVPTTSLDATTTIVPWANNNHNADGRATSAAQSDTVMSTFASDLVYLPAAGLQDLSSSAAPKTTTTTATSRRPPLAGGVPMSVPEESAVGANDSPPFGNVQPQQQGKPAAASHKQQQHTSVASSTGFGACGPLLSEEVAHLLASAEEHAARVSAAPLGFPLNLRTFVVLEFCDAGSLLDAIDRGWLRRGQCVASAPPNMTKVITLALHIASACAHLHSRGVVHADLSASNVLLCTARPSATVANLPGNSSSSTNVSAVVSPATSAAINAAPAPATAAQLVPDHNSIVRSTEVEDLDSSPAGGGGGGGGGGRNVSAPLGSRDAHSSVPAEDAAAAAAAASGYALPVKRFTLAPDKPRAADDMEFVAKVADFGKAVLLGPEGIVRAGGYATITHQAPEVLVEQLLSPAADVYALGVLVWQMFTGSRPWAGMSHQQIFGAIASGCMQLEWPNPAALLGGGGGVAAAAAVGGDALCSAGELAAAEGLVVLGRQCLSADREQRPTMAEAEARLKQLLRMLATRAAA